MAKPLDSTLRYAGKKAVHRQPRLSKAIGRAPHTSANPPVLASGSISLEMVTTWIGFTVLDVCLDSYLQPHGLVADDPLVKPALKSPEGCITKEM